RPRQVEVGDEPVDDSESIGRVDEDISLAAPRTKLAFAGRGFQRPGRGRSDGDDSSAAFPARLNRLRSGDWHLCQFTVHVVTSRVWRLHRLKRAEPDVQGNRRPFNLARTKSIEQFGGEMQPGGRRCYRTVGPGVDGLVAVAIARLLLSL